jgi:hypothetical protein
VYPAIKWLIQNLENYKRSYGIKMKSAKTFIAILLAVIMAVAFALPAMAASVGTSVTVSSGAGTAPLVKALWAHDGGTDVTSETADPTHTTVGVQILPTQGYQASHDITFVAVVTDANGVSNLTHVYADIINPDGSLKFEVELTRHSTDDFSVTEFDAAYNANMVTVNTLSSKADIDEELNQQLAAKYWGTYHFDNCQLTGTYQIVINALNVQTLVGTFGGSFLWAPLTAADFDFNAVNYGNVTMNVHKQVGGDWTFNSPVGTAPSPNPATIRNIGNTYLRMTVKEDDMGLGSTQINGVTTWNLAYDFRLGDGDIAPGTTIGMVNYLPAVAKGGNLTGAASVSSLQILNLCAVSKVDFSIQVNKDLTPGVAKSGTMIIGAAQATPTGPNGGFLSTDPTIVGTKVLPTN